MNIITKATPPKWFWVVTILSLSWYFMDMSAFFMRTVGLEDMLAGMPEPQQRLYLQIPLWVNVVFAAEVFGGVLGSLALMLKNRWALTLFGVSLAGVLAQTVYVYFMSGSFDVMGISAIVMPFVAVLIGVGMILFTKSALTKNWIG